MKLLRALGFVLLAACGGGTAASSGPSKAGGGEVAPAPIASWEEETFGPLRVGMTDAEAVAALGEPDERLPFEEMAATGDRIAVWTWTAKGVSMTLSEQSGRASVDSFSLTAPAAYKGAHGRVGIGSTTAEVERAYADLAPRPVAAGAEPSETDEAKALSEDGSMWSIGSPYARLSFRFEGGKVTSIFIGSTGAE